MRHVKNEGARARALRILAGVFVVLCAHGVAHANPTDWAGSRPIVPAADAPAVLDPVGPDPTPASGLLLQGATAGPEDGTWMRIAPPLGVGSYGASVLYQASNNRLIVYGGISNDYGYET